MKKTAATTIALILSIAMCFPASAFVPQKISSLHPAFASRLSDMSFEGQTIDASSLTALEAHPASELEIVLSGTGAEADLFLDRNGAPINTADVTISKMRAANVAVRVDAKSGGEYLEVVELNVKNAGTPASKPVLRVVFAREYGGVNPKSFDAELVIFVNGSEQPQSRLRVAGSFGCPEITVTAADSAVDSGGAVLIAGENIPSIEVNAGCNVKVQASMSAGGRYLITAKPGGDTELLSENNNVADVLELSSAGFRSGQIKGVYIESDEKLYVYDASFKAIGMTGEKLPFSEKYYLTVKSIVF